MTKIFIPFFGALTFLTLTTAESPWAAPPPPSKPVRPQQPTSAPAAASPSPPSGAKKMDVDSFKEKYWIGEEGADLKVVQNRQYTKNLKLNLQTFAGTISADPFKSNYTAGAGLGFYFTEYLGIHTYYWKLWTFRSDAETVLLNETGRGANSNRLDHLIGGELSWSILYGKLSLIGKAILHFDLFLIGGAGYLMTENGNTVSPWAGLGQQIFITKWLTFRADWRFMYWRENVIERWTPALLGEKINERNVFASTFTVGLTALFP